MTQPTEDSIKASLSTIKAILESEKTTSPIHKAGFQAMLTLIEVFLLNQTAQTKALEDIAQELKDHFRS